MTARVIVHCDVVHADRTPPVCRAFIATNTSVVDQAYDDAEAKGWTQTDDGDDRCPSCSRTTL